MRVIILSQYSFPIGMSGTNRTISYAKGLVESGSKVNVLCIRPTEPKDNIVNKEVKGNFNGIDFEYSYFNTIWPGKLIQRVYATFLGIVFSLRKTLHYNSENKIDIIISSVDDIFVNFIYFIISKIIKCKLVYIIDEYPEAVVSFRKHYKYLKPLYKLAFRFGYYFFDAIIVMTNALNHYFAIRKRKHAPIFIMPMTVEPGRFSGNISRIVPINRNYIAYIGELSGNKDGVETLIEAFKIVNSVYKDYFLYIIGFSKLESEITNLKERIKTLGISDNVIFTGRLSREDIPQYICHADLLVLARPNNYRAQGGFPTKLGEYLATGIPVVVTKVGEIPEYLTDGVNAFLSNPDSADEFAERIIFAINNPEIAAIVGKKGKELCFSVFNYQVQSKRLQEFLYTIKN